ncbi:MULTISPECIES: hypothetical protein [unclassified Flavobacterium]|uniref:hypothetical protein n=1 Tax=unclassified Flavobacterium TaxID=196869 RepID=UPI00131BD9DE|nr:MULTISPECIES: hypothetical protein [unclassified Flavobacterium]
MKKLKIKTLLLLALLSLIASCSNDPISTEETSAVREKDYYLKLGKKLENPYSVKNMKRALDSVKAKMTISKTAKSTSDFDIETSHLYVKIEPKNATEEALLKKDTAQNFFDYPLDYEFPEEVSEQIGTNNPDVIGSYYVAVPKDYVFPSGIKTEVLEELYIPEQDPFFNTTSETGKVSKSTINSKEDLLGNLLIEAFKLTHNEAQLGLQSTTTGKSSWWIFGKKWRPSGRITMWDNTINKTIPVEGAQVLIRQWFTVDNGITDANGYFSTGTVRGKAKYILQWERYHYSIRNGLFGQAETKSDYEKDDPWNLNITNNRDLYFANVHQAAHDYYYKDILGLERPQLNSLYRRQMKIATFDTWNSSVHMNQIANWGILPAIYLRVDGAPSEIMYGTTIHELTHSAHHEMSPSAYNSLVWKAYLDPEVWASSTETEKYKSAKRTLESWARAVEITLTNLRYQRLGYPNHQYRANRVEGPNFQRIQLTNADTDDNFYTPAFYDLTDNINQRVFYGNNNLPLDRVSGFTIKQVQDIIIGSQSWGEVKGKLRSQYLNTATLTDELLTNWQ